MSERSHSPRLVIVTQWYPPEQAPFGHMMQELAAGLVKHNWEVTIITGFPNHPGGRVFSGYNKRWVREEFVDGVRVLRVWLATSSRRTFLTRILTFLSFTLTASWRLLREPDVGVVFAVLQPLSVGLVLPLVASLKGVPLVFNIQDLHPDTQIRLGIVRNSVLIKLLRGLEKFSYRACSHLTVICESFERHCKSIGANPAKVSIVGNWIDVDRISPLDRDNDFRREAGCSPRDFLVLWAGTLGYVSGAETMLAVAERLTTHDRIRFLIVGEGPIRDSLVANAMARGLKNITFMPFQPEERLQSVQAAADVSLVTTNPQFADTSVPSKVLAYMAAGRAIIAAAPANSEIGVLLKRADCAKIVAANDDQAMADAILELASNPSLVTDMGRRARVYAEVNLSKAVAIENYKKIFTALVCSQ